MSYVGGLYKCMRNGQTGNHLWLCTSDNLHEGNIRSFKMLNLSNNDTYLEIDPFNTGLPEKRWLRVD